MREAQQWMSKQIQWWTLTMQCGFGCVNFAIFFSSSFSFTKFGKVSSAQPWDSNRLSANHLWNSPCRRQYFDAISEMRKTGKNENSVVNGTPVWFQFSSMVRRFIQRFSTFCFYEWRLWQEQSVQSNTNDCVERNSISIDLFKQRIKFANDVSTSVHNENARRWGCCAPITVWPKYMGEDMDKNRNAEGEIRCVCVSEM